MNFEDTFQEHLRADYKVLAVDTTEESRAVFSILTAISKRNETKLVSAVEKGADPDKVALYSTVAWNNVLGFYNPGTNELPAELHELTKGGKRDPAAALEAIDNLNTKVAVVSEDDVRAAAARGEIIKESHTYKYASVFILCDIDHFFATPAVRLRIKMMGERGFPTSLSHVVILSPALNLASHPRLANIITPLDFPLPDDKELEVTVRGIEIDVNMGESGADVITCDDVLRDKIVQGLRGLTNSEAANALGLSLARKHAWGEHTLETIRTEKAQIISQNESLKFVDAATLAAQNKLGGYGYLMAWLRTRKQAYSKQARAEKIDLPKGICIIGAPGVGKSVACMEIAKELELPLLVLDVGSLFGSLVGQSEGNLRNALRLVTAQAGCVLMIDEVDKAFNNAHTASGDSGTTSRVFGTLLSWMANKADRTFVVMTMNRTTGIPPEFLRAGRTDAMFYADIPTEAERREIIEIHLKKRGVDSANAGLDAGCWAAILKQTDGFVGSELEQVVRNARYAAFEKRQTGVPTIDEWLVAINEVTPLSKIDPKGIQEIREFCVSRAKPVNGLSVQQRTQTETATTPTRRRVVQN